MNDLKNYDIMKKYVEITQEELCRIIQLTHI